MRYTLFGHFGRFLKHIRQEMQRCSSTKCSEWVGTARRGNLRGPSRPALQHAARAMGRRTVVRYDGGEAWAGAATHWPGAKRAPETLFHW
jgi:hypothetical protein